MKPLLIVVSGAPGTGKTTVGREIATALRIPYHNKDLIKESLFDSLGTRDREWSAKLGVASITLLFKLIESHLQVGQSVVAESNFYMEFDPPRFKRLRDAYALTIVEVHCETEKEALFARLRRRDSSGERHPGHETSQMLDVIGEALANGVFGPLELGGRVIRVDTTDFDRVDYAGVISAVRVAGCL